MSSHFVIQVGMCALKETQTEREREGLVPWIIGVICTCTILLFAGVEWLAYASAHSNSRSGLCLIQGTVVQNPLIPDYTLTRAFISLLQGVVQR